MRSPRFCIRCGSELTPEARFCIVCGNAVAKASPPAAVTGEEHIPASGHELTAPRPLPAGYESASVTSPVTETALPSAGTSDDTDSGSRQFGGRSLPPAPEGSGLREAPQRRTRWPLLLGLVALLAAGGAAAALLILHPSRHGQPVTSTSGAAQPPASQPPTASASTPASSLPPQQQAAEGLAALLAQSVTDRSSTVQAVSDVNHCGPNLSQDAQTFQSAATSRQNLLSQLAALRGRAALSPQMLQALTGAWQASSQADQDFARWAQDEASQGCTQGDHPDPNYQAATAPDDQATTDKQSFAALWNPVATQYGLPTYQWEEL